MKSQPTKWEKIFGKHVTDKFLEYKKNSYNPEMKRQTTKMFKWAKDSNRHFSKEDI